jgi:hypothetical protein
MDHYENHPQTHMISCDSRRCYILSWTLVLNVCCLSFGSHSVLLSVNLVLTKRAPYLLVTPCKLTIRVRLVCYSCSAVVVCLGLPLSPPQDPVSCLFVLFYWPFCRVLPNSCTTLHESISQRIKPAGSPVTL